MYELSELMQQYCDGDAASFRELYRILAPRLFGYLIKMTHDHARAADLLQHTFMKVHRARAAYIRGADPVPWIYSIAHRTFIDEARKQARERAHIVDRDAIPEQPAGLHGHPAEHDDAPPDPVLVASTMAALGVLSRVQREAVVLMKLEGKSVAEAAEIAGTTIGTMRVRAHRGYENLRRILDARPAVAPSRPL